MWRPGSAMHDAQHHRPYLRSRKGQNGPRIAERCACAARRSGGSQWMICHRSMCGPICGQSSATSCAVRRRTTRSGRSVRGPRGRPSVTPTSTWRSSVTQLPLAVRAELADAFSAIRLAVAGRYRGLGHDQPVVPGNHHARQSGAAATARARLLPRRNRRDRRALPRHEQTRSQAAVQPESRA